MMKGIVGGVFMTVVLLTVMTLQTAKVEAKCDPGRPNDGSAYLSGLRWYTPESTGVSSRIWNYDPYVSAVPHPTPGFKQYSMSWVMLSGDLYNWSQIGWLQGRDEYSNIWRRWTLIQTTDLLGNNRYTELRTALPVNTWGTYKITADDVFPHYWTFSWGSPVQTFYTYRAFTGTYIQIEGEITSYTDQMPGEAAQPEYFIDNVYQTSHNSWYLFDGYYTSNNSNWSTRRLSSGRFYPYDNCRSY